MNGDLRVQSNITRTIQSVCDEGLIAIVRGNFPASKLLEMMPGIFIDVNPEQRRSYGRISVGSPICPPCNAAWMPWKR